MKRQTDYVRIAAELWTFTSADFAAVLDIPHNAACNILSAMYRRRLVRRERVGKRMLYGLSANGIKQFNALKPIDADARPFDVLDMPQECCCKKWHHAELQFAYDCYVMTSRSSDDGVIQWEWRCRECGEFIMFTYDIVPF